MPSTTVQHFCKNPTLHDQYCMNRQLLKCTKLEVTVQDKVKQQSSEETAMLKIKDKYIIAIQYLHKKL